MLVSIGRCIEHPKALARDRRGVTSIEYALIGAFIFLVIVASVTSMSGNLARPFDIISAAIPSQ